MKHIDATFAASTNDCTFDLIAKQGDAAGVIGVSDSSGVDIDLDGADQSQVAAIRVWHDGALSNEQISVLTTLLGDMIPEALAAFNSPRPVRVGARRRRPLSSQPGGVSRELTVFTSALDALQRPDTPQSTKPLLHLAAIVAAAQGGLSLHTPALSRDELTLAVLSAPLSAGPLVGTLIDDAVALGVLSASFRDALSAREAPPAQRHPGVFTADHGQLVVSPALSLSSVQSYPLRIQIRPSLGIDPASALRAGVTAAWVADGNVEVRISADIDTTTKWWVRARRDSDASIVAVAPLTFSSHTHTALLLVAEVDHIVIDVVSAVDCPVLSSRVGSLAAAYDAGRRAGRLDRLGRESEAAAAWRECANLHELANDAQRQKMALARAFQNREPYPATVVDHLL